MTVVGYNLFRLSCGMAFVENAQIEELRDAARRLVRELGFMRHTLAGTDLAASAVHALVEIGLNGRQTAGQLADRLNLEKSSVSRMVRKLIDAGDVAEEKDGGDGRTKWLTLTDRGLRRRHAIDGFARDQVVRAIARLSPEQRQTILGGLTLYAAALAEGRRDSAALAPAMTPTPVPAGGAGESLAIRRGYLPGIVGRVTEMHACYYSRTVGFGRFFETKIAAEFAAFAGRLDNPRNAVWTASQNGAIVGAIAIDGEDMGVGRAHLRWFIVAEGLRGNGAGRRLLTEALAFCDSQAFGETHLWTFDGLDGAHRLYDAAGFREVEASVGNQWGRAVTEQRLVRTRPSDA